ncbi:MAG: helix-turn-helix domain-containing protein [Prolixibacteraceae bacterium]
MNIFETIGLTGPVLVPLVVMAFLLMSKTCHRAKRHLALLMFILSFTFLSNFFYFQSDFKNYSYLHSLHVASVLMIYPSVFIYILLLTRKKIKFGSVFIHYIPALVFGITSAVLFYLFLETEERIQYLSSYRLNHDFSNFYMEVIYFFRVLNIACLFIQIPLYFILSNRYIKKHKREVENQLSETSGFDLGWIKKFNIAFFIAAVTSIFFYAVNPVKLLGNDIYLMVPLYTLSIIMCGFGIIGNNQERIILAVKQTPKGFKVQNLNLKSEIENLITEKKVYLNIGLKITDMAGMLNTNRTYLSQEINRNFNLSFSQYINQFRFEEAKEILKSNKGNKLTLDQIAEMCGWRSLSSLNRAFKNEGLSPIKFKKEYQ